jgi:hypothetical protein
MDNFANLYKLILIYKYFIVMLDSYTILETIYPMVYGTTETSSEIADQIYEHLLQYLSY